MSKQEMDARDLLLSCPVKTGIAVVGGGSHRLDAPPSPDSHLSLQALALVRLLVSSWRRWTWACPGFPECPSPQHNRPWTALSASRCVPVCGCVSVHLCVASLTRTLIHTHTRTRTRTGDCT